MSKNKKRWDKIRQNPKTATFKVLISALTNYGFEISEGKGSHVKAYYSHKGYEWRVTFPRPHGNASHVRVVYVKQILIIIDEINTFLEDNNG